MPAEILDVHSSDPDVISGQLSQQIAHGLSQSDGSKSLPTILLYDERGLRLYDDITTSASEYYLFGAEEQILKSKADEIVRAMHGYENVATTDEVVVELGAGALRKTSHILLGLSRLQPSEKSSPITYYALDLEQRELQRTLDAINTSSIGEQLRGKVDTKGMWGTYEDGLQFIRAARLPRSTVPSPEYVALSLSDESAYSPRDRSPGSNHSTGSTSSSTNSGPITPTSADETVGDGPIHILFLGSSLGNFCRSDAASFLGSLPLRPGSGDTLLIGMDHDNPKETVELAYNDRAGYTKKFIMNGLTAAGRVLGDDKLFDEANWEYVNTYDPDLRRHEAFYKSTIKQVIRDPRSNELYTFKPGEIIKVEESFKFSDKDAYILFTEAGLRPIQRWTDDDGRYSLWLLERPPLQFPLLRSGTESGPYGPFGVPTAEDWKTLWNAWDFITLQMISPKLLYERPIDLRHICLFYIGHIPTFLDIHLSKLLKEPNTEPEFYKNIFERGIDPNVDDPTIVHDHSIVPEKNEDWPALSDLIAFRDRVRARLMKLYMSFESDPSLLRRKVGRVLFMTYEHEAMHAETLLYMLLQTTDIPYGTMSPPGFVAPAFEQLAVEWNNSEKPKESTITLGPATFSVGHDDYEKDDDKNNVLVGPVEFGWDNEHPKREVHVAEFKIEWRPVTNGEFYEFYRRGDGKGSIPLPASWVEDEAGAIYVRTFFGRVKLNVAYNWPVMASYDSLSRYAIVKGGRLPTENELRLFMDQFHYGYEGGSSNLGFRNWHPIPATTGVQDHSNKNNSTGVGHNGGVWEWTSTAFEEDTGFEASTLYPGYSKDFFDGCHNVVLGGSFATIPRLSERRSLRNWYQRNYPYAFIGGRVAYDITK